MWSPCLTQWHMEMDVQQTATVALAGCPCQPWQCHGRYNTDTPRSVHVGQWVSLAPLQEGRQQELAKGRGEEEHAGGERHASPAAPHPLPVVGL